LQAVSYILDFSGAQDNWFADLCRKNISMRKGLQPVRQGGRRFRVWRVTDGSVVGEQAGVSGLLLTALFASPDEPNVA
jgi:hypothetical protein